MTTKHTPGRLYRDERASHAVVRLDGERNGYVDPIVAEFWDDFATIEEAEANADLYIAAPELVERLKVAWTKNANHETLSFEELNAIRALLSRIEKGE